MFACLQCGKSTEEGFHLQQREETKISLSSLMATLRFTVTVCKCSSGMTSGYLSELLTA